MGVWCVWTQFQVHLAHEVCFPLPFCAPEPGGLGLQSHRPTSGSVLEIPFPASSPDVSPAANQKAPGTQASGGMGEWGQAHCHWVGG